MQWSIIMRGRRKTEQPFFILKRRTHKWSSLWPCLSLLIWLRCCQKPKYNTQVWLQLLTCERMFSTLCHQLGQKCTVDNNGGENSILCNNISGNSLVGLCNVQTYLQCHLKAINKVNESFQRYNRGAITDLWLLSTTAVYYCTHIFLACMYIIHFLLSES